MGAGMPGSWKAAQGLLGDDADGVGVANGAGSEEVGVGAWLAAADAESGNGLRFSAPGQIGGGSAGGKAGMVAVGALAPADAGVGASTTTSVKPGGVAAGGGGTIAMWPPLLRRGAKAERSGRSFADGEREANTSSSDSSSSPRMLSEDSRVAGTLKVGRSPAGFCGKGAMSAEGDRLGAGELEADGEGASGAVTGAGGEVATSETGEGRAGVGAEVVMEAVEAWAGPGGLKAGESVTGAGLGATAVATPPSTAGAYTTCLQCGQRTARPSQSRFTPIRRPQCGQAKITFAMATQALGPGNPIIMETARSLLLAKSTGS